MKKTAFFIITLFTITNINAQIGITSVAAPQQNATLVPAFDSTKNFIGTLNVQSYKGQILFVLPKVPSKIKWGYENFKPIDYNPASYRGPRDHYGEDAEASRFNTKYEALAGKYFRVDSISEKTYTEYVFYLTNTKDETDRCCFIYGALYEHSFPFVVLSHFNYLKDRYVGKQYIIQSSNIHRTDIITGDSIKVNDDSQILWTVSELTIIENEGIMKMELAFIAKNGNMTTYVDAEKFANVFDNNNSRFAFEKTEWDNLVKKYGLSMMKLVLNEKIKVGMPEKLLIYSWGKPERINSSSDGRKQYVYDNDYVYVKDGKVVSWQSSK
ncbi:MAG: hypothetical protein K5650_01405 [Bacteroidales bacterium]|nr:hypothetical protein [Bacteroidales bacterium]